METSRNIFANFNCSLTWREAKKSVIVATALITCTTLLTFTTGPAHAKGSPAPAQAKGSPAAVEEDSAEAQEATEQQPSLVSPNRFFTGVCDVGPRTSDVIFTCFGIGFRSPSPRAVHCQLRNSPADPTPYPDQFACQVLSTSPGSVTVRIRRMDDGTEPSGWGQDLQMNLLIVN